MIDAETLAKSMYQAYVESRKKIGFNTNTWDYIMPEDQEAWIAAAQVAIDWHLDAI